jgi:hypothetical protein
MKKYNNNQNKKYRKTGTTTSTGEIRTKKKIIFNKQITKQSFLFIDKV